VSLTDLRKDLDRLVGRPVGLAQNLAWNQGYKNVALEDFRTVAVSVFAVLEPSLITGGQENWAHGAAPKREDAEALAIIEAIERYSGLHPPRIDVLAPYRDLADSALLPTSLPLFSDAQYKIPGFAFQPFDPDREYAWAWAYNFTRERPVLVPCSAVWYGHHDSLLVECSSGVAAHSSRGRALLGGILELIERDAFMLHWLNRISPPLVDLDALSANSKTLLSALEKSGYEVNVADLTTDLEVPVSIAMAICEDGERPALLVGAGAGIELAEAAEHAVSEVYSGSLSPTEFWTMSPPKTDAEIVRLEDHHRAYENPSWVPRADFLWASRKRVGLEPRNTLRGEPLPAVIAALARRGHDVLGVDITPSDVATTRIRIVRAIVPGLLPIAFGPGPRLGGARLYEAPRRMGVSGGLREEDLNRAPHCFP
jgi:ribosomal protein S12 methylthiotransferase accessory factor